MEDEILSTLEDVTNYASRVPLPDGVSRSSLRLDQSRELEDGEHTSYSSLGALEHLLFASRVPLPNSVSRSPSRSNRSVELEDARHTRTSSLDILERVPLVLKNAAPRTPAALSPVLSPTQHDSPHGDTAGHEQSTNSRSRESIESNLPNDSDEAAPPSFAEKINILQTCLPHLQNIRYPSRRRDAKINCYDFSKGLIISNWHAGFRLMLDGFFADDDTPISRLLEEQPQSDVDLRLIVAEDLSSDLIEQLGSLLDIGPEPFEEHLLNSGWRNGAKIDQGADSWITQGMNKDYLTVKWYRPVNRQFPESKRYWERATLLDPYPRRQGFSWLEIVTENFGQKRYVEHYCRHLSNIFRNEWDVHANIIGSIDWRKTVAWEERATLWSQERGSHRIGMSLRRVSFAATDQ